MNVLNKYAAYHEELAAEQKQVAIDPDTSIEQKRFSNRLVRYHTKMAETCLTAPTADIISKAKLFECGWCDKAHPSWLPPPSCPLYDKHYAA
jgi:hypothetical protein